MNKSKRIKAIKDPAEIHNKKNDKIVSSKILTIASAIFVVILVGALLFDQLYVPALLTVDGKKYNLHDLSYYFYMSESQVQYFSQLFGSDKSYWDMTYDEDTGTTVGEFARDQTMHDAVKSEVLYNQAVSEGYNLTGDEQTTVEKNVSDMLDNKDNKAVIAKNHFTRKYLTDIIGKTTLVTRYQQDRIDALDIDDDAIKAGISYDDYQQYDIEYLFALKKTTDENGDTIEKAEVEKAAAHTKLSSYYETAKDTQDWSKLLPEDENLVTYKTTHFIKTDTLFDDDTKSKIMTMENGSVSDLLETDDGYYIIRMKDNNSSESYDTAVKNAISDAEDKGFDEVYNEILSDHKYKINQSAVNKLNMGSLTLAN